MYATRPVNYCDDGDSDSFDGCSSTCTVENGYVCSGGNSTTKDTCIDKCGDGMIMTSPRPAGYCDDNNTENGDGCSSTCTFEAGFNCFYSS
jgi:cysteine-rich repeat protein